MTPDEHAASVRAWRAARDERLCSPDGWLAVVGLHWLAPGENRFGADPANGVILRGEGVPALAGSLWLTDGAVRLVPATPSISSDGEPLGEAELADDMTGEPTVMNLGTLRVYVIRRGDRLGLRVRDRAAPALAAFQGVQHFPIDSGWRVTARFEPAPAGREMEIVDITGAVSHEPSPGVIAFERDGATWRIEALPGDEDGSLWLVFADATSGAETYGGGRMLYTEPVASDGSVAVDFNLAYNPPCVFSPYATCPLPPAQNRLPLRIEAGELAYHP